MNLFLFPARPSSHNSYTGGHNAGMLRLLFFLTLTLLATLAHATDYHERLTLSPLPLGTLLASFDFRSNESQRTYNAQNFRLFPRSLAQTLQHADTKELHLRFTTGRWDASEWGARPWDGTREGGTGVELWAWIEAGSEEEAFGKWAALTQGLSGLFCASLNFVDGTRTTRPVLTFSPKGEHGTSEPGGGDGSGGSTYFLHGVLPGEVVCTENLTPFLKLLPCKGKAGISSLLDGHKVFDADWQSMSIDVTPKCPTDRSDCIVEIAQTIDMVLDIERSKRPRDNPIPRPVPDDQLVCDETKDYHSHDTCYPLDLTSDHQLPWSFTTVFGRDVAGACPLTPKTGPGSHAICLNVPHSRTALIGPWGFEFKSPESEPESRCYSLMSGQSFDIDLPQQKVADHYASLNHELLRAERTMTGIGSANGGMRVLLSNPSPTTPVTFIYFESLPWFMRPYMHTLKATITSTEFPWADDRTLISDMYYRPAIDRQRGTQLELVMTIPPATEVMLTYDFDKAVLRYTEYPPDANRGFNVAPAVIRVLNQTTLTPSGGVEERDVYIRTTSLLLALPTPDFSMPYNVIILTSTIMALAFGSIFNLLVRRFVGADEVEEGKLKVAIRTAAAKLRTRIAGKPVGKME
ncbi:GPI transamidase component GPI16 [Cyphellophora attinorum]|uniref:GPI transamidase component GPI16 n=1 Tax=Cyphellophora attinorum TaxID=1664694 RepID=A0A0N1H811_9EURO|nr:GPI transamidase component GPI16 [Phialophora attinorum]KPI39353.1 GPI transamidase component GPI16 [Phialophora attinorum]